MKRTHLWAIARCGVAIALIAFLVFSIGIGEIVDAFTRIRPALGLATMCCLFVLFILGGLNIWVLLRSRTPIALSSYSRVYAYSWIAALITPGQAGDVSLIPFLKKHDVPYSRTSAAYLIDKAITLCLFTMISGYGVYKYIPKLRGKYVYVFLVLLICFSIGLVSLKRGNRRREPITRLRERLDEMIGEILSFKARPGILLLNIYLTILKWLVTGLGFYLAFKSFRVAVAWEAAAVLPILSGLIGYIPVSVAGLGTVEATAVYVFSKAGVEKSAVLSVYILMRSLQYILALLMLSLLSVFNVTEMENKT